MNKRLRGQNDGTKSISFLGKFWIFLFFMWNDSYIYEEYNLICYSSVDNSYGNFSIYEGRKEKNCYFDRYKFIHRHLFFHIYVHYYTLLLRNIEFNIVINHKLRIFLLYFSMVLFRLRRSDPQYIFILNVSIHMNMRVKMKIKCLLMRFGWMGNYKWMI